MISVFTPFHKKDTAFLKEAYQSLLEQKFQDWQWIILLNSDALNADMDFVKQDARIQLFSSAEAGNIGYLKKYCISKCSHDIVVELDYDDILIPDCLLKIQQAFQDQNIQMVYSNCAEFEDQTWKPNFYSEQYGWINRPFTYKDHELVESVSWPPSAQMMRRIEWAPNHVRAWRKSAYDKIGGHNEKLKVGDDHELCCRFYIAYGAAGIKHIDECLYLYRVHATNNVKLQNEAIQYQTDQNYLNYSRDMAMRWAKDNNLRMLDLGGRFGASPGFETVDRMDADVICDLNGKWNFEDNSVGVIRASHVFEHLKDSIHTMNEAFRVLAPGGWLFIDVPSTDGRGAWQDPTHITFFNENSFWYYTNKFYAKYISPEYVGRFQMSRIVTWFPDELMKEKNIPVVQADLICLKPPYSQRPCGEVLI